MASTSLPETYKVLRSHGFGTQPVFDELPLPKPGKNQVLVKMEYAPLNPTDIASMNGFYASFLPVPYSVGSEGSGHIVAVGEDLQVPHKVGDKVYVFGGQATGETNPGTFGQYYLSDAETCSPIEGNMSMQEAASHFVNPGTAYYMGVVAQRGNHKAAIHTAGSSALGRMLIRLFKHKGIKLINIVRNDKYIEELKAEGADYVLNSQAADFEEQLREIAAKEQATLAFDAICGEFTAKVIHCMPPRSVCYVYGALSAKTDMTINLFELFQGKTLAGLILSDFINEVHRAGKLSETLKEVHSLLPTIFKSNIQKEFSITELKEALGYYQENSSKGKIIFKLN